MLRCKPRVSAPWKALAASASLVLLVPAAADAVLYVEHVRSYAGLCGPHAPDIPAHPCDEATYRAEFAAGFAGVGLIMLDVALGFVTAGAVGLAWLLIFLGRNRRNAA